MPVVAAEDDTKAAQSVSIDIFRTALSQQTAPQSWSPALQALWYLARGDWERAHQLAQTQNDTDAAWVHAHLHRVEGDLANARYWYSRAGRDPATDAPEAEFESIAIALLSANSKGGERR